MVFKIPKKTKIGSKTFEVQRVKWLAYDRGGSINCRVNKIYILEDKPVEAMEEVFLHELTHGVLRDMRRHDINTERFVKAFSRRLYKALEGV